MGDILYDDFGEEGEYGPRGLVLQAKEAIATGISSAGDNGADHGGQRVVDLVAEDEDEYELVEEDGGEQEVLGEVEEDDLEPLPPRRRPRTSGTGEERGGSQTVGGGTQVQRRVASYGPQSGEIPSSGVSRDFSPRSPGSRALGGTPVQRRATSSLGRRSRDHLSSDAARDSGPRDKRLRVEPAQGGVVSSSPPTTLRGGSSISTNSDTPSGAGENCGSRKYLKKSFVPDRNQRVHDLAKKFLQSEVLAYHPWPNTATTEGMVRRSWANARKAEEMERKECYPGSGRTSNETVPTKEPDGVSLGIVSAFVTMQPGWRFADIFR